jgi:oligopeptide/dipeptide ABC transporter ATP-binding protein
MAAPAPRRRRSLWSRPTLRAFLRSPTGVLGLVLVTALIVDAIIAPSLLGGRATNDNFEAITQDATWAHPFGTNSLGQDIFARALVSLRLTLEESLGAAGIAVGIGGLLGIATAVVGSRGRGALQRTIDTMIAFPAIILVIFITIIIGRSATGILLGVGVALSFSFARFVSTLAMSIGGRDYVAAAHVLGVSRPRVMYAHILPNLAEPLLVNMSFLITFAMLTVAALSFIGIGVQPPSYDLGQLLATGVRSIYEIPAAALGPAALLAICALSFGFLGEGISRAINPQLWTAPRRKGMVGRVGGWYRVLSGGRAAGVEPAATVVVSAPLTPAVMSAADALTPVTVSAPDPLTPVTVAAPDALTPVTVSASNALTPALAATDVVDDAPSPWLHVDDESALATAPSSSNGAPTLDVRDLVVSAARPSGRIEIVRGVSLTLPKHGVLGIVGESGSGKTMTAMAIADLLPANLQMTGEVALHGEVLASLSESRRARVLGTEVGLVFQDPMSSLNPALTIARQLTEVVRVHRGASRSEAEQIAIERLRDVHLPVPEAQMKRYPHELSGGMRQRVVIAMALMNNPSLLICDEPTTALDVTIQAQIVALLKDVNERLGTSIIIISHNLALVAQTCDRVLIMYAGRFVEDLSRDELVHDPQHPYTRALMGALPVLGTGRDETTLTPIAGEVPDVTAPPTGCAFHPRCPLAQDICRRERPPLIARRPSGRRVACWVSNQSPS